MPTKKHSLLFVSWVGDSDLLAWAANKLEWIDESKSIPGDRQKRVLAALRGDAFFPEKPLDKKNKKQRLERAKNWKSSVLGGLEEAVAAFPPANVKAVILSNLEADVIRDFSEWAKYYLGVYVQYEPFRFQSDNVAMSYDEAYKWAETQVEKAGHADCVWFNLTAGSSAMTTALVILGKLRWPGDANTRFVIMQNNHLVDCPIPLNLIEIWNERQDALKKGGAEYAGIVGKSPSLRMAIDSARRVAPHPENVLILGPSGSGKELLARLVHYESGRKGAFIAVNCAMLSPEMLVSELFGHVKGAYTGAIEKRDGKACAADGGTLFLDEIGDCPAPVQAQLLRFLQPNEKNRLLREVVPLGSDEPVSPAPEIRIVSATNKKLWNLVQDGKFREDLYWRLAQWTIELSPLQERPQDIPDLVRHFLDKRPTPDGFPKIRIDQAALDCLTEFDWPGNVRQLELAVGRLAICAGQKGLIGEQDVRDMLGQNGKTNEEFPADDKTLDQLLARVQRFWIEKALEQTGGNRLKAAKILGLKSGQTLSNRLAASKSEER